jgi:hypothetical protein
MQVNLKMISIPFNGRNIFRFLPSLLFLVAALYFFPFPVTEIPSFGNLQIDTGIATIPTGHGRGGLYGLSVNGNNYACGTEFLPGECLSQSRDDARGKIVTIYWMEKKICLASHIELQCRLKWLMWSCFNTTKECFH